MWNRVMFVQCKEPRDTGLYFCLLCIFSLPNLYLTQFCFVQISNTFDEDTVQRQLRYTGMLETVRIRQAGYNVRLTYDEFIQMYRILLPKGLLSSQVSKSRLDTSYLMSQQNIHRKWTSYEFSGSNAILEGDF